MLQETNTCPFSSPHSPKNSPGSKRVEYDFLPDYEEPLGAKISKRWGRKMYHGVLIEKFDGGDDEGQIFRGIYTDGMVHDFPLIKTLGAVKNTIPPFISPEITLELYDESVSQERMGDVVSEDENGAFTIKYRPSDKPDFEDPLGMPLATQSDDGKDIVVGMAISRITGENTKGVDVPIQYRVMFSNGEGWVGDLEDVKRAHQLFLDTPGLEPIVVSVRSVVMS